MLKWFSKMFAVQAKGELQGRALKEGSFFSRTDPILSFLLIHQNSNTSQNHRSLSSVMINHSFEACTDQSP